MESLSFEPPALRQDQNQWCALVLKMVCLGEAETRNRGPIAMNKNRSPGEFDDSLVVSLDQLRQELTVLRMVLDEIRDQLEWANQNRDDSPSPPIPFRQLTSMPRDPCAPDWAERLNQFSAADVDDDSEPPPPNLPLPKEQGELF